MKKAFLNGVGVMFLVLACIPKTSMAQTNPQSDARARRHFEAAVSYIEDEQYQRALAEFEQSYALSHRKQLFFNISLCHEYLQDYAKAAEYLKRYLREVNDISNRAELQTKLAELEAKAQEAQLQASQREAAQREAQRVAAPSSGQPQTPVSPVQGPQPATSTPNPQSSVSSSGADHTPVIISYAAGGAGLLVFGVFGGMAMSEDSKIKQCSPNCAPGTDSDMKTFSLVADIGLIVGVAGAVTGTVLLLTAGGGREESAPTAGIHGLRFDVLPVMGTQAGQGSTVEGTTLQLSGRF